MSKGRMNTYIVTVRWKMPDGSTMTRKIAENGLTPKSARNKVNARYGSQKMTDKLGKHTIVSVVRK